MKGKVVVITRNGYGAVWIFSSLLAVRLHPVHSVDDVVATSGAHLLRSYERHEVPALAERVAHGTTEYAQARDALRSWADEDSHRRLDEALRAADIVFDHLCRTATEPPTDPAELLKTIVEDRKATEGRVSFYRAEPEQERIMTTKGDKEVSLAGSKGEEQKRRRAQPKPKPAPPEGVKQRAPRAADDTVIRMGEDGEGKPYGPDNNPKRQGSDTYDRFKNFHDGITVGEAKAKGSTAGDIAYEAAHGYIILEPVAPAAAEPIPAAEPVEDQAEADE